MKRRESGDRENEIKLAVTDATSGRRLLRSAGFRVSKPRVFESNLVFDTADRRILHAGALLRLRRVKRRGVLAYKGPVDGGSIHKSRQEVETEVENPAAARLILEQLGYQPVFRYDKFRTEFARPGEAGTAMLDETPMGVYLELEGSPRWVDRTARKLGSSPADYITRSYGRLYTEFCEAHGMTRGDMVFPPDGGRPGCVTKKR
jgi:adenylate cyclase, class 2